MWQKLGTTTASEENLRYRLGKLAAAGILKGRWLDCGCADGGYARAIAALTGCPVVGIDVEPLRLRGEGGSSDDCSAVMAAGDVERLRQTTVAAGAADCPPPAVRFVCAAGERLPFRAGVFDGVLLNETLEHVDDDRKTLAEVFRVLKPGGHVAVMSPNRGCPFEGHGAVFGPISAPYPVPLLPWLPARLGRRFMVARNYWPRELRALVRQAGFRVRRQGYVLPVFGKYALGMPQAAVRLYRRLLPRLEQTPIIRRLGVSTLVVGQKPYSRGGSA
jgi:SAM-dependent methyltransferase